MKLKWKKKETLPLLRFDRNKLTINAFSFCNRFGQVSFFLCIVCRFESISNSVLHIALACTTKMSKSWFDASYKWTERKAAIAWAAKSTCQPCTEFVQYIYEIWIQNDAFSLLVQQLDQKDGMNEIRKKVCKSSCYSEKVSLKRHLAVLLLLPRSKCDPMNMNIRSRQWTHATFKHIL